jgi:hypothetical protein
LFPILAGIIETCLVNVEDRPKDGETLLSLMFPDRSSLGSSEALTQMESRESKLRIAMDLSASCKKSMSQAAKIQHEFLRSALLEHKQTPQRLAGLYAGLRIHLTREYRASRGSSVAGNEHRLPALFSRAAYLEFQQYPHLWSERSLADEMHYWGAMHWMGQSGLIEYKNR